MNPNLTYKDSDHRHVGQLSELLPVLRSSMTGLPPAAQDAVVTVLEPFLERGKTKPDSEYRYINKSLNEADTYYAIHNSDLGLLQEATSVAAASYALLQDPIAVIGGLVVLLLQYRRKRIKLTAEQGLVLNVVKKAAHPGWSCEKIHTLLPVGQELTTSDVQMILDNLKSVIRTDGSETALVRERDGLWMTVDL